MTQYVASRHYKGKQVHIYFAKLTDEEISQLINACEQELELRSQENMQVDV